jgi:hypothetical protein
MDFIVADKVYVYYVVQAKDDWLKHAFQIYMLDLWILPFAQFEIHRERPRRTTNRERTTKIESV